MASQIPIMESPPPSQTVTLLMNPDIPLPESYLNELSYHYLQKLQFQEKSKIILSFKYIDVTS